MSLLTAAGGFSVVPSSLAGAGAAVCGVVPSHNIQTKWRLAPAGSIAGEGLAGIDLWWLLVAVWGGKQQQQK